MTQNLFTLVVRLAKRNKAQPLISFAGLACGLFVFILIYLYVSDEFSYDRYHEKYEHIYRVVRQAPYEYMGSNKFLVGTASLAEEMRQNLPGIELISRIGVFRNPVVSTNEQAFFEETLYAVDSDMFDIFAFEIIAGNKERFLKNPQSVILSESFARKYFSSIDQALGKTIRVETYKDLGVFVVDGVIRDMPWNSHFRMDMIFPFEAVVTAIQPGDLGTWYNNNYYTYFTLANGVDVEAMQKMLDEQN